MLSVKHLNVWYGVTEVLRDVSFEVPENTIVALLGGNGSGKTTILNALSGLLAPRAGSIVYDGEETAGAAPDRMVRLATRYLGIARSSCDWRSGRGLRAADQAPGALPGVDCNVSRDGLSPAPVDDRSPADHEIVHLTMISDSCAGE